MLFTLFFNRFNVNVFQLAAERASELAATQEKEEDLAVKKKKLEPERKVFTKGVGKYIDPKLKKEMR